MPRKVRTTVYIDPGVLREAQEMGLNVSKTCENSLKLAIRQMLTVYDENGHIRPVSSVNASSQEGLVVRLPEFESGLEAWKASVLDQARPQPHSPNWKHPDIL